MGHVKDLPKQRFGISPDNGFQIDYVPLLGKRKVLEELRRIAASAERVLLAADPDREGEVICWHLAMELQATNANIYRIMFNEITKPAILQAMKQPERIDERKVNAQQARRVLDRIVGYKLSPLLWKKVKRGLSAGRVQSVALRQICDREADVRVFKPQEYWIINAVLRTPDGPTFRCSLARIDGEKREITTGEFAHSLAAELNTVPFTTGKVEKRELHRKPMPPFITSTLQQEAIKRLGFTAEKAMQVAQALYEGKDLGEGVSTGLITYMRTDSPRLSAESIEAARSFIHKQFGPEYLPAEPRLYKGRRSAQDAHEAIRPTDVNLTPDRVKNYLAPQEVKLYQLIWERFIACQMADKVLHVVAVDIEAGRLTLVAQGSTVVFPGFEAARQLPSDANAHEEEGAETEEPQDVVLPPLAPGMPLVLISVDPNQRFTRPPARYTEASLVKWLEERGIGRPSTYAAILRTIRDRNYVNVVEQKFHPTELGMVISDLLVRSFPQLLDPDFTAHLEGELDDIEEGSVEWSAAVQAFYGDFLTSLARAEQEMPTLKGSAEPTNEVCELCGKPLVIKWGQRGRFIGCMGWPECRFTREFATADGETEGQDVASGRKCPKCGGPLLSRMGKFGRFLACSSYPRCNHTEPFAIGLSCYEPGCTGELVERSGKGNRVFYGCSRYPECNFRSWQRPVGKACPECGHPFLVEGKSKQGPVYRCPRKGCSYKEQAATE